MLFKWNKEDKKNGQILVNVGYYGHRKQIGILKRTKKGVLGKINFDDANGVTMVHKKASEVKKFLSRQYANWMNEEVEISFINAHSGKSCTTKIARGSLGTSCDPSTDMYWVM